MTRFVSVLANLLVCLLAACGSLGILGTTRIGDIVSNPARFEGSEVRVKGKVVDVSKIPLIDIGFYSLRDDSGEIFVVARRGVPPAGSIAVVTAKVESVAIIQGQAVGLRLTEIERSAD